MSDPINPYAVPPPPQPASVGPRPRMAQPLAPTGNPQALGDQVMAGTRFIVIPRVMSGVFISFRTNSKMRTVERGTWPAGTLIASTLVTVTLGWLGVFGMIYTARAIPQLWNGGRDITRELLVRGMGEQAANYYLKQAPRKIIHPAVWVARAIICAYLLFIAWLILLIHSSSKHHPQNQNSQSSPPSSSLAAAFSPSL